MRTIALSAVLIAFGTVASTVTLAETVAPSAVKFDEGSVTQSLTGQPGDAAKGREWFVGRKLGNCLACHQNSDTDDHSFHGEVGPVLDGVAGRWSEAELRAIVSNAKMIFDGTIMPAFYKDAGYNRPLDAFDGKTILSAQQVEDIVAYLLTLKE